MSASAEGPASAEASAVAAGLRPRDHVGLSAACYDSSMQAERVAMCVLVALGAGCGARSGASASASAASAQSAHVPYGVWQSPLSAEAVAQRTVGLSAPRVVDGAIYWLESRPAEQGRNVVVRWTEASGPVDVFPRGFDARTKAHGYGGGVYTVDGAEVYFANLGDRRVYRARAGRQPEPITGPSPTDWFADFTLDRPRNRLLAVRERHGAGAADAAAPVDSVVAIDLETGTVTELVSKPDFIVAPRLSPDGTRLAFVTWEFPSMPWDSTTLWVADMTPDGSLETPRRVAGGANESVVQPTWSPEGELLFVSDRDEWWNVYAVDVSDGSEPRRLAARAAEFTPPPWTFGTRSLAFAGDRLVAAFSERGRWAVAAFGPLNADGPSDGGLQVIEDRFVAVKGLDAGLDAGAGIVAFAGGSAEQAAVVVRLDLESGRTTVVRRVRNAELPEAYVSEAEEVSFATTDGQTAHALFFRPHNPDVTAPPGARPPLLVTAHGGPTSAANPALALDRQFWTTRGFAVVDVNYRGSTGYGRTYRQALYGGWGDADVDDLAAAVRFLAERGDIDPGKVAIRGGSAGGFSTLNALIQREEFRAGAAYSSISDLEALARDTHKFESRYLDKLVGPYPEARDLYRARSPIHYVDKLDKPLILFHGREDAVTPLNQAELFYRALRERGVASELRVFDDEGHGLRRAQNRVASLEAELAFYRRVFGL